MCAVGLEPAADAVNVTFTPEETVSDLKESITVSRVSIGPSPEIWVLDEDEHPQSMAEADNAAQAMIDVSLVVFIKIVFL